MPYSFSTRTSDALAVDMAVGATTATLVTGSFGIPARKIILTIDGNLPLKTADFECTVSGTAITDMKLINGPDVAHTTGAIVWAGLVDDNLEDITVTQTTGWIPVLETLTCGSNSTLTCSAGLATTLNVGDTFYCKDDGVAWYGYVVAKGATTITVYGGDSTGAVAVIASGSTITVPQYSKSYNPTGHPGKVTTTAQATGFTSKSYDLLVWRMFGRTVQVRVVIVGVSNATGFTFALPITSASDSSEDIVARVRDNTSTFTSGLIGITGGDSTATMYTNVSGNALWTGSGTKALENTIFQYNV